MINEREKELADKSAFAYFGKAIELVDVQKIGLYKDGFREGLKAGRPQWHDLRKAPTDLPPKMLANSNFSIDVLSDKGEIVCYNFHYCEWFYWRSGSPIAWCEIPTFDKE